MEDDGACARRPVAPAGRTTTAKTPPDVPLHPRTPQGEVYYGMWDNDLRMGLGCHMWPDGSKYEGEWAQGVQHGRGRYVWADGASKLRAPCTPPRPHPALRAAWSWHAALRRGLGGAVARLLWAVLTH